MKVISGYNHLALPPKTVNRNHPRRLAIFNDRLPKWVTVNDYKQIAGRF